MPYSKFTLAELKKRFKLHEKRESLFSDVIQIKPSIWLSESLEYSKHITLNTEKVRSEVIVMPVLMELVKRNDFSISVFSGISLNISDEEGLSGECDFIISAIGNTYSLESPAIAMVEAKDNDIDLGIPQCIAQMIGAQRFNQDEGNSISTIYGCVTTGTEWQFLRLKDNVLSFNNELIYIIETEKLLGFWQTIINSFKTVN